MTNIAEASVALPTFLAIEYDYLPFALVSDSIPFHALS